jgi:5-methylcytosine-specific restriction endonuclease McrA
MCGNQHNINSLYLQAHHLKPLNDGGKNEMRNLISLCNRCHNIAEDNMLSRSAILNYYDKTKKKEPYKEGKLIYAPDNDWHKWVYGGYKNPNYQ